jgi:hypothetical protein
LERIPISAAKEIRKNMKAPSQNQTTITRTRYGRGFCGCAKGRLGEGKHKYEVHKTHHALTWLFC